MERDDEYSGLDLGRRPIQWHREIHFADVPSLHSLGASCSFLSH